MEHYQGFLITNQAEPAPLPGVYSRFEPCLENQGSPSLAMKNKKRLRMLLCEKALGSVPSTGVEWGADNHSVVFERAAQYFCPSLLVGSFRQLPFRHSRV